MTNVAVNPEQATSVPSERVDVGSLLRTALALHQGGRLAEAEDLYRRILVSEPRHFDSLHLLGVIFSQRGEYATAVRQIATALTVNPNIAAAHNNSGVCLSALDRADEALASFDAALALAADYLDAHRNRADTLLGMRRFEDAVASYDRAIALDSNVASLFTKRGHALSALNRPEQAIDSYDRAIALEPTDRDAFFNRGLALGRLGRLDDAIASYDRAIALDPGDAEALSNRGAALKSLKRFVEAVASCERAIEIDPSFAVAFNDRGIALKELNRLDEALASYDAAIQLSPGYGEALSNRANVLASLGRLDGAIADYDRALAVNPDDATARCNRGMIKLLTGRFDDGWEDYEARWWTGPMAADRRRFVQPQWTGEADINGKRLLLSAEQGLGDTIMAARYVRQVADLGAQIILSVPATLASLMHEIEGITVVPEGQALPDFDLHCPLMSLPRAFDTTLDSIPAQVPYLRAPAVHLERWRRRLPRTDALKVGVNWAGNPQFKHDAARSIGLRRMLPLLGCSGVAFFSLQKDLRDGDAEILRAHPQITPLGREVETFADTAAIVSLLDLVISSDTSVVHAAGALGRPVWVLLQSVPDWRWLLDRDESPWYPTARLFRQTARDDWPGVIDQVGTALDRLARAPRTIEPQGDQSEPRNPSSFLSKCPNIAR
ncbi:MAG TPA: tetratricopeptide repeat protein [Xanthobacteraceae bacterium]|nr:tetratricopeptide repeat protein [Xanthobacteraceae bacterium]